MEEKVFLTILCEDDNGLIRSTVAIDNLEDAKNTAAFLDMFYSVPTYVSIGVTYEVSEVVFMNEVFYEMTYSNEE